MPATTIICRTCMLEMELPEGMTLLTCPACGTNNSRPQAQGMVLDVFRRATQQRLRCDFAGAEDSYQYVLRSSPDEHEALWGLALCRYGVEYVEDTSRGRRLPVVHAVRRRPLSTDPDFTMACELAPSEVRAQYEKDADYIDKAIHKILRLAGSCQPYDVFLCHKTSHPEGGLTQDYSRAFSLYHRLTMMGYRVFFAPEELKNVAGAAYEAGIYHALHTSKVMLVLCSRQDFLLSPWVRTEWQRFLEMSYEEDSDKQLIPLIYDSLSPRHLPVDFRQLQALTMDELDATQTLMNRIFHCVGTATPPVAPVQPKPQPVAPAPAPVRPAPKPVAPTPAPVQPKLQSTPPAPAPVRPAPKPVAPTPAPVQPKPQPAAPVPAPVRPAPKPVAPTPAPVQPKPQPAAPAPAPVRPAPKPVAPTPAPVQPKPQPAAPAPAPAPVRPAPRSVTPASPPVQYTSEKYFLYTPVTGGCRIDKYTGSGGNVNIPPTLSGRQVVSIGPKAFAHVKELKHITLPEGLTYIGETAFDFCSLTGITLPQSLTSIEKNAFSCCNALEEIRLPSGLLHMGKFAFTGCRNLKRVTIAEGVPYLGDFCFTACENLTSVRLPASLSSIGANAFSGCRRLKHIAISGNNASYCTRDGVLFHRDGTLLFCPPALELTEYTLPEDTVSIFNNAFMGCSTLRSVQLSRKLTAIAPLAFNACTSLCSITVAAGNKDLHVRDGVLFHRDGTLVLYPLGLEQTDYHVPDGTKAIAESAFSGCRHLQSIHFPASVTTIHASAFSNCESLRRIHFSKGLSTIGPRGFQYCSALTKLSLPESLTYIDSYAFQDCYSLTDVRIPSNAVTLDECIFGQKKGSGKREPGDIPEHLRLLVHANSPAHRYAQSSGLNYALISSAASAGAVSTPAPAVSSPEQLFTTRSIHDGCEIIKYTGSEASIRIPDMIGGKRVLAIGEDAFRTNIFLKDVTIPDGVRQIGDSAFSGCSALTSVAIPASVESIGAFAFALCTSLKEVVLPDDLRALGKNAFKDCPWQPPMSIRLKQLFGHL